MTALVKTQDPVIGDTARDGFLGRLCLQKGDGSGGKSREGNSGTGRSFLGSTSTRIPLVLDPENYVN